VELQSNFRAAQSRGFAGISDALSMASMRSKSRKIENELQQKGCQDNESDGIHVVFSVSLNLPCPNAGVNRLKNLPDELPGLK
jgi:hypothetical protein